jgi:hypothetical protein
VTKQFGLIGEEYPSPTVPKAVRGHVHRRVRCRLIPMPVDERNYSKRGRGNSGIVLHCPNIVPDRLIYFVQNEELGSWVIRDLITGMRLDNLRSALTIEQIETDAAYDEHPPWLNVEESPAEWGLYLRLRTSAVFPSSRLRFQPPNAQAGEWQPL